MLFTDNATHKDRLHNLRPWRRCNKHNRFSYATSLAFLSLTKMMCSKREADLLLWQKFLWT